MKRGKFGRPAPDGSDALRDRAVSPVVGVVLLIGIVLLLAAVGTYMAFELTEKREPAPEVALSVERADGGPVYRLIHSGGERLRGERMTLRGAADPDSFAEGGLAVSESAVFFPTDEEVTLVWTGRYDTSYVLRTFEVEETLPDPDEGCDWVDSETNGGEDDLTVDGAVVDCAVETDDFVKLQNGAVVIGATTSNTKYLEAAASQVYGDVDVETTVDADDARLYGDVVAGKTVNLQDGTITGDVASAGADVKLTNGTVDGTVTAGTGIDVQKGSSVGGDLVSDNTKTVDVDDSTVEGDVMSEGTVNLNGVTVEGDVYVYASDFKCTDSTVDGESCGEYSPKSPSDW